MKRLAVALLLILGLALAQGRLYGEALGGTLSLAPSVGLAASVRAGADGVVGPLGLRGQAGVLASGGVGLVSLGVDALYPLSMETGLRVDLGIGLDFLLASAGGASGTEVQFRALAGVELPVQGNLALRVEPTLAYGFSSQQTSLQVLFGPRLYLR